MVPVAAQKEYVYSLPEIEHYIENKIPVENITDELLADVIPPSDEALATLKNEQRQRREQAGNRGGRRNNANGRNSSNSNTKADGRKRTPRRHNRQNQDNRGNR